MFGTAIYSEEVEIERTEKADRDGLLGDRLHQFMNLYELGSKQIDHSYLEWSLIMPSRPTVVTL